jgi:hypothetical protein
MATNDTKKTAVAVRSAITSASAKGMGACFAIKMPNQLAPASAHRTQITTHENKRRLILRRTRQDLLAASSMAVISNAPEQDAPAWPQPGETGPGP